MNIWTAVAITFITTLCACGLVAHLWLLNRRIKDLENANLTAKGGLPRPVQDELMNAIATLNYLQMNREVEDAYTAQLRNQLSAIRDIKLKKETGAGAD